MCGIKSCLCILRLWLSSIISALNFLNVFHTIYMPLPVNLWSMSSLLMMASLFAEWEVQHFPYVKKSGAYVDQTSVGPASDAWKRKWTEPSTRVPDTFKHLQIAQGPLRQWNRHRWFGQVIPGKNFRATERSKSQKEQTMKKIEKAWKSCICGSAPAGTQRSSGAMCGLEGLQEFRRRDFQANEAAVDRSWWWSLKNSLLQKFCFHTICLYSGGWPFQGLLCGYTRRVSLHAARGTPWLLYCAFSFLRNSIIRHSQCMASTSPTTMRGTRCKDGSCNC